eukprot:s2263_g4.t1
MTSVCRVALLLAVGVARGYKILLFWSVDSDSRTIELVKRNVAHARQQGGRGCCDVMLAHYSGSPRDWGGEWYANQVKFTLVSPGYKYNLLKKAYRQALSRWEDEYEYVWALDSDIDFTSVDLIALFSLARASQSLIVGPTFTGTQSWLTYTMSMHEVSAHGDTKRLVRRGEADSTAERINVLGKPDPRCKLRHTDFVEMTAPLLSNKVLALILKDCVDCVHDKAEWGLDRVWCKLAQKLVGDVAKPCALLDAAPVAHLDWKKAVITPDFKASELAVKSEYPEYWSDIRNIDCVNDFKDNVYVAEPVPHASANVSAPLSSEASIQPASK